MSLRRKTLLAIGLTSAGLSVLLLALAQIILLKGFDRLQEEAVQQNMLRVHNVITNEIANLDSFAGDWGYWDDTYQYVQDKNAEYVISNLNDASISNLKVNFFLYTDISDHMVFGEAFDLKDDRPMAIPADLAPQGELLKPVLNLPDLESNNTGILLSSEGPMMVAARSILTSQRAGPAAGKLVFGRFLDQTKINAFAEQTQLTIDIRPISSEDLPAEFADARAALLSSSASEVIYTLQNETAEGFGVLNDITGKPTLILKMGMPNSIYQQGQHTVLYFVIALFIAGLTFGAVVMWLLEKIVLSRLGYLNKRVNEIASSNTLSERIRMDGKDELSSLTATINNSLGVMEQSQAQMQQLNTQLEEKVNDLNVLQTYRDRFFTNASHEFRTPMAVLRTQLYLAQKQPALWQKHLDILISTTNQLSDILSDVFDMAQFRRQHSVTHHQEVEFTDLVTKSLAAERPRAYQKSVQLITDIPNHDTYLHGNQSALEQAVEKLLTFVINYSSPNSTVQISVSAPDRNDIPCVQLEISSFGLQLNAADLTQIFLPFYKSSEGNIRNTGLQLSIAKEIVELHKGDISAEMDAEKGICFRMNLPATRIGKPLLTN